jgi:hypothetical protein
MIRVKKKTDRKVATGGGKGTLLDTNPMLGTKERSAQLNNLGKYGEPHGERTHHVRHPKDI